MYICPNYSATTGIVRKTYKTDSWSKDFASNASIPELAFRWMLRVVLLPRTLLLNVRGSVTHEKFIATACDKCRSILKYIILLTFNEI